MTRKNFLITSHTEGINDFEKKTILYGLVFNLKNFFPDCFILIASNSEVEYDTQKLANVIIIDKHTHNQPHGHAELQLLKKASSELQKHGIKDCFKMTYDFVIDETNYTVFDKWLSTGKDFVGCYWNDNTSGIGTWAWYNTLQIQDQIFDFDTLDNFLEIKVFNSIKNKNIFEKCHIYSQQVEMFNNDWSRCDLVQKGGAVLKYQYGKICAVVFLSDFNFQNITLTIQSLLNQTKLPNHILFVDQRSDKKDIRQIETIQELLIELAKKYITWNLIYNEHPNDILGHLIQLNFDWCWLLNDIKFLDKDHLKNLFRKTILEINLGTILDKDKTLFYRNKIVFPNIENQNLSQYIIDKMKTTSYNNVTNYQQD